MDSNNTVAGCSCITVPSDPPPLRIRWTIGLGSTPLFHALGLQTFLSVRLGIDHFLGPARVDYERLFVSLLSIGSTMPVENIRSSLEALNRHSLPTVAAVNGKWRQLLDALGESPLRGSCCVRFVSARADEIVAFLVNPTEKTSKVVVKPHLECEQCLARPCPVVLSSEGTRFLSFYEASFFRPISRILDTAVKRGWGIYTDFFNANESPEKPSPSAARILDSPEGTE